jgi:hypothetical protein
LSLILGVSFIIKVAPANFMNKVGFSAQVRLVALTMLIVRIWLSSRSSIAAMSTPDLTVAATVLAASWNVRICSEKRDLGWELRRRGVP